MLHLATWPMTGGLRRPVARGIKARGFLLAVVALIVGLPSLAQTASASALVPLTITVVQPDGVAITGLKFIVESRGGGALYNDFVRTGASGSVVADVVPNSHVRIYLDSNPDGEAAVIVAGGSVMRELYGSFKDENANDAYMAIERDVATAPQQVSLTFPYLQTRTIRVLTEAGQPVANAQVSATGHVSPAFDDGTGRQLRIVGGIGANTNAEGWVRFTTWATEPDPEVVKRFSPAGDMDRDGVADGLGIYFNPKPTSQLWQWVNYSEWAYTDDVTVTLPFVAILTPPVSVGGTTVGSAEVTASLQQPSSAAPSGRLARMAPTGTPIAGQEVTLWQQDSITSPRTLLSRATSSASGVAKFKVNLTKPTRVVVGLANSSYVAGVGIVRPRTGVGFARIQYDAPGSDSASNRSRNGEWFALKNYSASTVRMNGWIVRNRAGQTYRFGSFSLRAGTTVKVHTGRGVSAMANHYWGSPKHRWSNPKDTATLRNSRGARVDTCSWSSTKPGYKDC